MWSVVELRDDNWSSINQTTVVKGRHTSEQSIELPLLRSRYLLLTCYLHRTRKSSIRVALAASAAPPPRRRRRRRRYRRDVPALTMADFQLSTLQT